MLKNIDTSMSGSYMCLGWRPRNASRRRCHTRMWQPWHL